MTRLTASRLSHDIDAFLVFKRRLGFRYRRSEFMLRSFERFVRQHAARDQSADFEDMLGRWLARIDGRAPVTVALELGVLRQLCLHKRRSNSACFVPDRSWAPQAVASRFLPYVFSCDEIGSILETARHYDGRNFGGRTLRAFLLVLYCTGLRPGEGARLLVTDVDLEALVITVRESKGKSRLVPFREDLARELTDYLEDRNAVASGHDGMWTRRDGKPVDQMVTSGVVRRLFRQLGLKPARGRIGPGPYDFRHTFAVHRLTRWYEQGVDIHARLPWLSAYMGHDNILGTEVYLNATPELLSIASERFAAHMHSRNAPR